MARVFRRCRRWSRRCSGVPVRGVGANRFGLSFVRANDFGKVSLFARPESSCRSGPTRVARPRPGRSGGAVVVAAGGHPQRGAQAAGPVDRPWCIDRRGHRCGQRWAAAMSEASAVLVSAKIGPTHLGRDAYVYVRQSTLTQLREHTESLIRQYELRERAVALGWDAHQVRVIDADLGRSGAEATAREGFKDLVADVGLGKVGIIFGIEVSRLARNNSDWYQLLDLCALTDTLIADTDGIYHPADFNDRLVLGLKGTMSEAELHLIRSRLTAGLRHKAARGELRQFLPVGFDYDETDAVVITPDEAVVEAIAEVFRRFAELGTARQVLLSVREDGLLLPRRPTRTGRIVWQPATYPAVHDFLTNPVYAGAFVFGRTRTEKRIDTSGKLVQRTMLLPREQWAV